MHQGGRACSIWRIEAGGGASVDKEVKHKNKITSQLLQVPEDNEKKLTKFVSETKTQEGGDSK